MALVVPHLYGAFRHSHEGFDPQHLDWVADIDRDDYYIRIAAAWYFSIALVKQWDATLPYIRERRLPEWTHRKTIQKAVESYRIDAERKTLLKNLR